MNEDEKSQFYNAGYKACEAHTKMSPETEKQFALMTQQFEVFEDKLDCLIDKVDILSKGMLYRTEAEKDFVNKIEFEKVKGKIGFYAWITPILTGAVGVLITYALLK